MQLAQNPQTGAPVYKYRSEEQASVLKDLEQEDFPIYERIQESANRGI